MPFTISKVEISHVFVPEGMEFLCTMPVRLSEENPQWVPSVAHERATFEGTLISCGIVVQLISLSGYRRG